IVQWTKESWRGDAMPKVLTQKSAQLATGLQPGHVAVQVQAVDARGGQRHVVAQYGGNAGAWHDRRLLRRKGSTRRYCHSSLRCVWTQPYSVEKGSSFTDDPQLPSGKGGEGCTRRVATSAASEGARVS